MRRLAAIAVVAVVLAAPGAAAVAGDAQEPRVVSYFRVDAGWTEFWRDWRPELVSADLARIASLRANTVRAVVAPDLFGYPHPTATYAARLSRFVALADTHGLRVQLTLFDWWYEWSDLAGSRTWARELLAPYVGDSRIAAVELKNELVLKPHTIAWARAMLPFVRSLTRGRTPVTISVSGVDPAGQLERLSRGLGSVRPDAFDVHYYGGGGELAYDVFTRAKEVVRPTPLRVGETGYATTTALTGLGGVPRTRSAQEAAQAHFLASVMWAARAAGLPPPGMWLLDDLRPAAIPDRAVAHDDPELHFGLFRTDSSPKPGAAVVRAAYGGRPPLAFNGGFEDAVEGADGERVPARWSMQGDGVAFALDRAVAREGSSSARLSPTGAAGTGSVSIAPPNAGLRGGERIVVECWARSAATRGRVFVVLEWHDRGGRRLGRSASPPLPRAAGWRRLRVAARAPRRAAYVRVALVADAVGAAVWFDAVTFRRGLETPSFQRIG